MGRMTDETKTATSALLRDPAFEALVAHIQHARGVDFRGYKRTSLQRRIGVRMQEVGVEGYENYQALIEAEPKEVSHLLNTVLINVTSFFRDPDAWDSLKSNALPGILSRAEAGEAIRIWSVGCSSGEEAYSIAMLLADELGRAEFCRRIKIYATDLDSEALRAARHAAYPSRAMESVPESLLERYFERVGDQFHFDRELRKCVIFGQHNVVHDAPISRIDLVICRNLLIYLEAETQSVVLPRLHYSLRNGGFLFLGKAETQLARSKLFTAIDGKHRIFAKAPQEWRRTHGGGLSGMTALRAEEGHARMLEGVLDAALSAYLVIDAGHKVVFANVAARKMLDVGEGDIGRPFHELPISYRPIELRARIEQAESEGRQIHMESVEHLRPPAISTRLTIDIMPLTGRDLKIFAILIAFTDVTRMHQLQQELQAAQESLETTIEELQSANEELETTNEELQSTNEELETTNEELQSTNEELETMNEELRSTNEELETTNEELQSTNEELETMNEELRSTNEELEAANQELRRHSEESAQFRSYTEAVSRSLGTGLIVLDEGGKVVSWNRWCENTWSLRAEEVVGEIFLDLDAGLPVRDLAAAIERARSGSDASQHVTCDALDRRGRAVTCEITVTPLVYEDRSHHGVAILINAQKSR